jgi:predicted transposase/invertase (TIGR01784 family)
MEMQSTVDFQMPYRLLLYQVEIWRDVLKNTSKEAAERKEFRLPPIIPIVLYNGEATWTAVRSFREMVANHTVFGSELLDFTYILLDVQRYEESELLDLSNMIGAIFLLERQADVEHLSQRLRKLGAALQSTPPELLQRFVTWFANILMKKVPAGSRGQVEQMMAAIHDKGVSEVRSNLEKTLDEILEKKFADGIELGFERGIEQGIEQERERTVRNLIAKGMTDDLIKEVTGLPQSVIDQLRSRLREH